MKSFIDFVLDMCSKPIFCSKVAHKGKICSRLLEPQKLLQTPTVAQKLPSTIRKGLMTTFPFLSYGIPPPLPWPVTDPRLSSPSPFNLLQIERTINYFLPLTPSTNRWQLVLTSLEQLEGRQQ